MDEEMLQMFDFLSIYLQSKTCKMKIGNMKWEVSHNNIQELPETNKYDSLNLMEFITLYKIDRLVSLNIINEKISNYLKNLFYSKKDLELKLQSLVINEKNEDDKKLIHEICKKIDKIDKTFNKYHLLNNQINLKVILDNIILNENYNNLSKKQIQIYNELAYRENNDIDKLIGYLDSIIEEKNSKTR